MQNQVSVDVASLKAMTATLYSIIISGIVGGGGAVGIIIFREPLVPNADDIIHSSWFILSKIISTVTTIPATTTWLKPNILTTWVGVETFHYRKSGIKRVEPRQYDKD